MIISQEINNVHHLEIKINGRVINPNQSLEDQQGKLWFSHAEGLLKFDGYDFTSIPNSTIFPQANDQKLLQILKGPEGNIWLLSKSGKLSKYLKEGFFKPVQLEIQEQVSQLFYLKDKFYFATNDGRIYQRTKTNFTQLFKLPGSNNLGSKINSLALDNNGIFYIGTDQGQIFIYDSLNKQHTNLDGEFSSYPGQIILEFDQNENLWIGTETTGVHIYNTRSHKFVKDFLFKNSNHNLSSELIYTLFCDKKGHIWIGTDGNGLFQYNNNTGKINLYSSMLNNKYSLSSNTVIHISEDSKNNLWVATNYGDFNILPSVNRNIVYHSGSKEADPQRVLSIYTSKKGDIWLGTDGNGLTRLELLADGSTKTTQFFKTDQHQKGFYVQSITEDRYGNIWLGTYKNGLWVFDLKSQSFRKIPLENSNKHQINDVRTVFVDSRGRIWAGTSISVNLYSSEGVQIAQFANNQFGLEGSVVEDFIEDDDGRIWLGFYNNGLYSFNENSEEISKSFFNKVLFQDESGNWMSPIGLTDMDYSEGFIWLVDPEGVLMSIDLSNNQLKSYKNFGGMAGSTLMGLKIDLNKNIWLSSNYGIIKFNPYDLSIVKFDNNDGLGINSFMAGSSFKDPKGFLYFGGTTGVIHFNPADLFELEHSSDLLINRIDILHQPAEKLIKDQLTEGINEVNHLHLDYNQSSFSFGFSAIDNILNPNHHYHYRLKGFQDNWISTSQNRIATFTNVPPGKYKFELSTGDQFDPEKQPDKSILITIHKPWWHSTLAMIIYILFFVGILIWIYHWISLQKKLLAKDIIYKKEKELQDIKMNFFIKMSHEIQTPLTLIAGPIEDMLNRAKNNGDLLLNQRLNIISNNVRRLSKIAFELTTLRDKDLHKLKLLVRKNNLYDHLHEIGLNFKEEARIRKIDFSITCPRNLSQSWYDKDKLSHMIYNLLSNAFKFTPTNGNIQLTAVPIKSKDNVKISVSDSGPGIPGEDLNKIFTLFYQSRNKEQFQGSGIGLHLTKELVDLHKGKITVKSSADEGTRFTITLPISEDQYGENEKIMTDSGENSNDPGQINDLKNDIELSKDTDKKTILVIEDNFELRIFLKDLLINAYNVILAENGQEGLHLCKAQLPDLVLSDIMMPLMDGIEMTTMLQKDSKTKHIPIILITAKNSSNSRIHGLESGAVEYINKPFNTNELLLKVKNIINAKDHIISKIKREEISQPTISVKKSQDDIFLEKLVAQINARMGDSNFKMEELAQPLHMSYSTLYRKCQMITGLSLIEYVSSIRLKKGAILITNFNFSVSEAAFRTGFSDPKYFSKCFKSYFKKTPSEFRMEAQELNKEELYKKYQLEHFSVTSA